MTTRILYLLVLVVCNQFSSISQQDANWIFGYQSENPNDSFMGVQMNFVNDSFEFEKFTIPFRQGPSAVISDSKGQLVAYSNSCDIANADHDIMPNGDGLNPGHVHDNYCEGNLGAYPVTESGLLISTSDTFVHMIHTALSRQFQYVKIYQTSIELVDGEYRVTEKNKTLLDGWFTGRVDACRHGNGRDWWVVIPHAQQGHYVSRYTTSGIDSFVLQPTGIFTEVVYDVGQSVFSPDGSLYGRCDIPTQVQLMDFDRCSGILSNARQLILDLPVDSIGSIGMAFGPNSRFLYVSTVTVLFQFDMYASDVQASQVRVGIWDGTAVPLPVSFYQLQLAANGKIYMSCASGCTYLHVIHYPEKKGLACGFDQRGVRLPVHNAYEVPNIPVFSLGSLVNSPCDTLFTSTKDFNKSEIQIIPNPNYGRFEIQSNREFDQVIIYNFQGRLLETSDNRDIDLIDFPTGLYLIQVLKDGNSLGYARIVKK